MKRLQYKIDIKAPVAKVYKTMLGLEDKSTYEAWTAEFNPSSTYEGSWDKGSKILFVGVGEDGQRGGMVSEIAENILNQFVSIRHLGIVKGDKEISSGEEVEAWERGLENYSFEENNGMTTLTVDIDMLVDYIDYFDVAYPKALNKLKQTIE